MSVISRNRLAPADKSGHLYYVRLDTVAGPLYKVGFTKLSSVHERLAYNGAGHESLISEVLLFAHLDDAYTVEQTIHATFSLSRAFQSRSHLPYVPLFQNGQFELYADDILQLDSAFTPIQAKQAKRRIQELYARERYGGDTLRGSFWAYGGPVVAKALGYLLFPITYPLLWLYDRLNPEETAAFEKHVRATSVKRAELVSFAARIRESQKTLKQKERTERQLRANALKAELERTSILSPVPFTEQNRQPDDQA